MDRFASEEPAAPPPGARPAQSAQRHEAAEARLPGRGLRHQQLSKEIGKGLASDLLCPTWFGGLVKAWSLVIWVGGSGWFPVELEEPGVPNPNPTPGHQAEGYLVCPIRQGS